MKLVSTFSGCGGSCQGFKNAGFTPLWANEFIPEARAVYEANHPGVPVDPRSIRDITAADILAQTGLKAGELDCLEGSPPCSAFSTAGKRDEGWGKVKNYSSTKQRVDDLFFEFIRIVRGLRPKVVVAENVPAMAQGKAIGIYRQVREAFRNAGYRVESRILEAERLGVPQRRHRLIFVAIRQDLPEGFRWPEPTSAAIPLRAALESLADPGLSNPLVAGSKMRSVYEICRHGENFEDAQMRSRKRSRAPGFTHYRLHWDRLCPTVMATSATLYHPDEPRTLGINEVKRVCSFPDEFILLGTFSQQWERLGRSVPPKLMEAVASRVRTYLESL